MVQVKAVLILLLLSPLIYYYFLKIRFLPAHGGVLPTELQLSRIDGLLPTHPSLIRPLLFPAPHYTTPAHRHSTGNKLLAKHRGIQAANLFWSLLENCNCTYCFSKYFMGPDTELGDLTVAFQRRRLWLCY